MRKKYKELALLLTPILCLCYQIFSQNLPCAVEPETIRAYSLANSNSICLVWPANDYRQQLRVARRIYTNRPALWQPWSEIYAITNDPASAAQASEYCDTNVSSGVRYEYRISVIVTNWVCGSTTNGPAGYYQYINTGTAVPVIEQRGKLILLVESSLAASLGAEIARLTNDLIGDGYQVFLHNVAACEVMAVGWKTNVANTKAMIRADYNTDTNSDWTIFIIGHVPVPYSGLDSPGSHPENFGAHPADWYYADMNETGWTDTTVSNTSATETNCWNIPGDGKFDPNNLPSTPTLRIGRVDLVNMPAFGKSEADLVRQYLDRDHAWRNKQFTARDRALMITNAIPYEMHNIYSSFFGNTNSCDLGLWLTNATNSATSYLFAASKGSAGHDHDNQIGWTTNFANTQFYAVFATMYGSYYGDWDGGTHSNNFLWAPICTPGYTISTYYHENEVNIDWSAMGDPIGQDLYALASSWWAGSQKRYEQYAQVQPNGAVFTIDEMVKAYTSLVGDPTLRLHVVAPPTNVTLTIDGLDNVISWTPAVDSNIQGYYVYRAPTTNLNAFVRITSPACYTNSLRDTNATAGAYSYMVRTIKLEQTANHSYFSASQGILATPAPRLTAAFNRVNGRLLVISGEAGQQYTIEGARDLSDPAEWYPLTNITLSGPTGTVSLTATNPIIFYRLKN